MRLKNVVTALLIAVNLTIFALAAYRAGNYDFRAFYCAGATARHGADPYRTAPLYLCERTQTASNAAWLQAPLPAPFPPYAIAAVFEPLSQLPYRAAAMLWTFLLVCACVGAGAMLWRLTQLPAGVIVAALALSLGIPSVGFGEVVPLYLFFLCAAMWFARRGEPVAAAACAAATLLEPHLGLPVCCALALAERRTRAPLFAFGVGIAALSVASFGTARIGEYLGTVLQYHALSELPSDQQLSLSTILYWAGISAKAAIAAGTVSYLAAVVAGTLAGAKLALTYRDAAYAVAVAAAFAVVGGVFVHQTQIVAAIPAAMLLMARSSARTFPALMLLGLAIPWVWDVTPLIAVCGSAVAFAIAFDCVSVPKAIGIAVPVALMLAGLLAVSHAPHVLHVHALPAIDPEYPESGWAQAVWTNIAGGSIDTWLRRLPVWAAVAALAVACLYLAAGPRLRVSRSGLHRAAQIGVSM